VSPIKSVIANSARAGVTLPGSLFRQVTAAVRLLNNTINPNWTFAVARDPDTKLFIVLVHDRSTGDLLEQMPAEDILKRSIDAGQRAIL
jgi:hypothetical protein